MKAKEFINESWTQKYKKSINCSHPKGFSQKAHCAGKKKHNESVEMELVCESCGMCQTHGSLNEIRKGSKDSNGFTKCWPGKHAEGTKKGKNGGQVRNCVPNESQGVAEDTLNEFDYNKHVKMLNAYMKKLGYSYIGHGTDAHVFSKEAGSVTKVLIPKSGDISTAKNPFLAFLNYCKKNAGNPHLPKFTETTKEPIQLGSEKFDQVVMERLQEVDPKYEDLLVSITDSIEDGKPLDPQYQPYIKFYQTLKSVMLTGRKLGFENDIITFQSVNIMQRGNTLVIIDPWTGKGQQGVAEGNDQSVSLRDMVNVVDEHYPKYYAELSGSDISDKQFERAIVNAYKKIMQKQGVAEAEKHGLYYNVNKRKAAGTSRPASSPKAPTAQAWKDAAKTAKTESLDELSRIMDLSGLILTADEQFDIIESMVENWAEYHGVDAEQIWEDFESVDDAELLDESAAWHRSAGKSKKGGLNAKGVASYRAEHPGSKLQMAVTTKPSKLKPGSKAAKRRKSFCARMGGNKGPMKKPNGDPTRKALALRKWNC